MLYLTLEMDRGFCNVAPAARGCSPQFCPLDEDTSKERVSLALKRRPQTAFTLVEVMVAAVIIVVFFACIFEVNALCLRAINASKESIAAQQSIEDRRETLRNLAFSDLTNPTYIQNNVMNNPPNGASISQIATEVVTISKYPTAGAGETIQFTRSPDGTLTANASGNPGASLVRVNVQLSWTTTFGGRSRIEQATTLVSNGSKK